MEELIGNVNKE